MALSGPLKKRLYHQVPAWVSDGSVFHIRLSCEFAHLDRVDLTEPKLGALLLESARFYHHKQRWCCLLFLLMPDHVHALIAFPREESMSKVLHDWKAWHKRFNKVTWQDGFFDHRLRNDREFELKAHYIRQNPVVKSLCDEAQKWPWFCEPVREQG